MKNILVPTDFSEHANNALKHAIAIANHFGSDITLYFAYKLYSSTGSLVYMERFMREDAEKDINALLKEARPRLKNGATIKGLMVKGDTIPSIIQKADRGGMDLIVMGTQGASGLKEIFIGSVTSGVIRKTKTAVLAIPNNYSYQAFKSIVLAIDSKAIQSATLFRPLLFLLKAYEANLSVYHKVEGGVVEGLDPSLTRWLIGVEYTNHYDFSKKGVNESISNFLKERGGDLLCMIRHKRGFLERMFHQSVTRKEAFTTSIPLLVLQDHSD